MGADGWFVAVSRSRWDEQFPDVEPSAVGLYTADVLGVEAVYGYEGDNLIDYESYGGWFSESPTGERRERLLAAVDWFRGNAERHMVWT